MPEVSPSAIVDPKAQLAEGVEIGAYSCIGPDVKLAENVHVGAHVVITGRTSVGARTVISPFACIGGEPQDRSTTGEETQLVIGEDNVLREHVTIHVGTPKGGGCTQIGDDNFIMNGTHIGHDCRVGSHCTIASFSGLAGHVVVEDHVVLGAYVGVHQFVSVGELVMAAANAKITQDAPPYSMVVGDRARFAGLNLIGLRRQEFPADTIQSIRRAYRIVFRSKLRLQEALVRAREEEGNVPEVENLLRFLEKSERGFCR